MKTIISFVLICFLQMGTLLVAQAPLYDLGQFYPEFQEYASNRSMAYSYLSKEWPELEQWRIQGRAKMMELLSYAPEPVSLNPEITEKVKKRATPVIKSHIDHVAPQNRSLPADTRRIDKTGSCSNSLT